MVQIKGKRFIPFISEKELLQRVSELGQQITADYKGTSPVMIGILNGAFMFLSDLSKHIDLSVEISFIKVSSYVSMSSTGKVRSLLGLEKDIMDRDVIIVEDIVDTGLSMAYILERIKEKKPHSIQVVSLLLKPDALSENITVKYIGFKIPDKFVIGYGLDYDGYGRNLKEVYQLK